MRTRPAIARIAILLCSKFFVVAAFGQTIYTWTGAGDGVNLVNSNNWSPVGLPNGSNQDTAQWNGLATSNLVLTYGGVGWRGTGFGSLGVIFRLTSAQTNSVQIISSVPSSAAISIFEVEADAGAGAFTLGDSTGNLLQASAWPPGAVHPIINNSTNPLAINPSVRWAAGGGNGYTYDFQGTGNFIVSNYLSSEAFSPFSVQVDGSGAVYWTGAGTPENTSINVVTINGGTLVLQSSVFLYAPATMTNNSTLILNAPAQSVALSGVISGSGSIQVNNGTLTLSNNNTYTGTTTVSNGTLFIDGGNTSASTTVYGGTLGGTGTLSGPVTLAGGATLAPGASNSSVGTLTISNDLNIGGNLAIEVNKSLAQSNDMVVVSGVLTNTGTGTITVSNLGPALAAGDKFTLFSQPVQNGAALNVTGAGMNWINNLAVDGSIVVVPPAMTFSQNGNSLQVSWMGSFKLQSQTNSINGTNWVDYPGGGSSPVTITVDPSNGSVFFRLVSTP